MDRIPELLGEIERLRAGLWAGLASWINRPAPTEDRLLATADAASRLGVDKDWLYRNSGRLPFDVRLSVRHLPAQLGSWTSRGARGEKQAEAGRSRHS